VEALRHGGIAHKTGIRIKWLDSEKLEALPDLEPTFRDVQGIVVPGGFGYRGIEGKIRAIQYARENQIPFLGLCLGLQTAVIEFARHVAGLRGANSTEFEPKTPYPVVSLLSEQEGVKDMGGTMRLGAYPCRVGEGTLLQSCYETQELRERHRHRYEVNNKYLAELESRGLRASGRYVESNLVEVIEIPDHPWFLATQFHPEFTSRPNRPGPLFKGFVKAAAMRLEEQEELFQKSRERVPATISTQL
jgi:CTP synthase